MSTSRKPKAESKPRLSPGRLWLFRGLFIVLFLIVPLGLAELTLRWIGFGYPTAFLLSTELDGEAVWVDNHEFGRRYFPKRLVRVPQPLSIPKVKAADTLRIVVLGESAAMGDPDPAYGLPRQLEVLLQERFAGHRIEVVNASMTAINSHVLMDIARDCLRLDADAWVIYAGNNEVVGPFGPGTVFGAVGRQRSMIRLGLWMRKMRVVQWTDERMEALRDPSGKGEDWGGIEMFQSQTLSAEDPRLETVRHHFISNLEDVVDMGRRAGIPVILSTVASNVRDFPPLEVPKEMLSAEDVGALADREAQVFRNQNGSGAVKAVNEPTDWLIAGAEEIGKGMSANTAFVVGRHLLDEGEASLGAGLLVAARDRDQLRFRPDTRMNRMVRMLAESKADVRFVDAEKLVAMASIGGVPGDDFLWEHVHLTFDGNYLLARALAEAVVIEWDSKKLEQGSSTDWLVQEEVEARLAHTEWDEQRVLEQIVLRLARAPFSSQIGAAERDVRLRTTLAEFAPARQVISFERHASVYRDAMERRPDDWRLRQQYAELLAAFGDRESAIEEWRGVLDRVPRHFMGHYHLGRLLVARPVWASDAETHLRSALGFREDFPEAWESLGQALGQQKRFEDADAAFVKAIELRQGFASARVNRGLTTAAAGNTNRAVEILSEAVKACPDSSLAHQHFGRLLYAQGKVEAAAEAWEHVAKLSPRDLAVRLQLAEAWQKVGRVDRAGPHLVEALQLNPDNIEVRFRLGVQYAQAAQLDRAEEQFREVIRRQPTAAAGHLNLGLALLGQKKYEESLTALERALELEPGNDSARQAAEMVRRVRGQRGESD